MSFRNLYIFEMPEWLILIRLKNKINSSENKIKDLEEEITMKDHKIQEMSMAISSNVQKSNLPLQEVIKKQQEQIIELQMGAKEWKNRQVLIDQQETIILEQRDVISQWKEKYEKQLLASNKFKPSAIPEIITTDSVTNDNEKTVTRKYSAPSNYNKAQRIKTSTDANVSRRHSSFISSPSLSKAKEIENHSENTSIGRKDLLAQNTDVLSASLPSPSSKTAFTGPVVVVDEFEDHSCSDDGISRENSESDEFSDPELIFF